MAQTFTCPSCAAPLDYDGSGASTIECPYCSSSVIVPRELRFQRSEPVDRHVTMSLKGQAANLRELSRLVKTGQKAQAYNLYQQVFKVSLTDAMRAVDQLSAGGAVVIASNVSTLGSYAAPSSPMSSAPSSYTSPPIVTISTATQPRRSALSWVIGCFVLFIVGTTVITTVLPLLGMGLAFLAAVPGVSTAAVQIPDVNATTTAVFALATAFAPPTAVPTSTDTPVPTEDVTATVEAQATATALADFVATQSQLPVKFSDDFDQKRGGWPTGDERNDYYNGNRRIEEGVYRWTVTARQGFFTIASSGPKTYSDFFISVDTRIVDGPDSADVAVVFRDSPDAYSFYYFAVRADGTYSFSLFADSGWDTLIDWTNTPAIRVGDVNHIAISAQGSQFVFLINGQVVDKFENDRLTEGQIGLGIDVYDAGDQVVFEFDNLEIRAP